MNVEEIKSTVSMRDVARRYGIKTRNGMCSCPFHGKDRHPSMKLYESRFKCFACGASGDVIAFVQMMENCDFKTAYLSLGGTYERHKTDRSRVIAKARLQANKERRIMDHDPFEVGGQVFRVLTDTIDWLRFIEKYHKPYTEVWCYALDQIPILDNLYYETFCTNGVKDKADGYRIITKCRNIEQRLLPRV
jgi:hypothetical protein